MQSSTSDSAVWMSKVSTNGANIHTVLSAAYVTKEKVQYHCLQIVQNLTLRINTNSPGSTTGSPITSPIVPLLETLERLVTSLHANEVLSVASILLFPLCATVSAPWKCIKHNAIHFCEESETSIRIALQCFKHLLEIALHDVSDSTAIDNSEYLKDLFCPVKSFRTLHNALCMPQRLRPVTPAEFLQMEASLHIGRLQCISLLWKILKEILSQPSSKDHARNYQELFALLSTNDIHADAAIPIASFLPLLTVPNRELRCCVLDMIDVFLAVLKCHSNAVHIVASIMPGILSSIHRLLIANAVTLHTVVLDRAIGIVTEITLISMTDDNVRPTEKVEEATCSKNQLLVFRNSEWYDSSIKRLTLVHNIAFATSSSVVEGVERSEVLEESRVRNASLLLSNCCGTLPDCIKIWSTAILSATQHSHKNVRETASNVLTKLLNSQTPNNNNLLQIMSTSLVDHLHSLPHQLISSRASMQYLRLLSSEVEALSIKDGTTISFSEQYSPVKASMLKDVLSNTPQGLTGVVKSLVSAMAIDWRDPALEDTGSDELKLLSTTRSSHLLRKGGDGDSNGFVNDIHSYSLVHWAPRLLYVEDPLLRGSLFHLIRSIGFHMRGDAFYLLAEALQMLATPSSQGDDKISQSSLQLKCQVILVINEIIDGFNLYLRTQYEHADIILNNVEPYLQLILEKFLEELKFVLPIAAATTLPLSSKSPLFDDLSLSGQLEFEHNDPLILLRCVVVGIGHISSSLGSRFHSCVANSLYPVLHALCLGEHTAAVTASKVLQVISAAVGEPSISSLLVNNSDYIVDGVSAAMRSVQLVTTQQANSMGIANFAAYLSLETWATGLCAPRILSVLLRVIERDADGMMPILTDVIEGIVRTIDMSTIGWEYDTAAFSRGLEESNGTNSRSNIAALHTRQALMGCMLSVVSSIRSISPQRNENTTINSTSVYESTPPIQLPDIFLENLESQSPLFLLPSMSHIYNESNAVTLKAPSLPSLVDSSSKASQSTTNSSLRMKLRTLVNQYAQELGELKKLHEPVNMEPSSWGATNDRAEEEVLYDSPYSDPNAHDPEPIPLTSEEKLLKLILSKCRHWLSSSDVRIQSQVLSISTYCIFGLREQPPHLFPEVALLWPSLMSLWNDCIRVLEAHSEAVTSTSLTPSIFQDKEIAISEKARSKFLSYVRNSNSSTSQPSRTHVPPILDMLTLVETLAMHCSRFLAQRFSNEAWPLLSRLLNSQCNLATTSISIMNLRIMISAFRTLRYIIRHPDLSTHLLLAIALASIPYLHQSIHPEIHSEALVLFYQLGYINPSIVHYVCLQLQSNTSTLPTIAISSLSCKCLDIEYLERHHLHPHVTGELQMFAPDNQALQFSLPFREAAHKILQHLQTPC